jgi:DNA polymerase sigma
MLSIENPYDPDVDMGRNSFQMPKIRRAFQQGNELLAYALGKPGEESYLRYVIRSDDPMLSDEAVDKALKLEENDNKSRKPGTNIGSNNEDKINSISNAPIKLSVEEVEKEKCIPAKKRNRGWSSSEEDSLYSNSDDDKQNKTSMKKNKTSQRRIYKEHPNLESDEEYGASQKGSSKKKHSKH